MLLFASSSAQYMTREDHETGKIALRTLSFLRERVR
jgi:hypothetical protein